MYLNKYNKLAIFDTENFVGVVFVLKYQIIEYWLILMLSLFLVFYYNQKRLTVSHIFQFKSGYLHLSNKSMKFD